MKRKVVPTIFATNLDILKKKFEILSFADLIHLDICDGNFVETKTINILDSLNYKNRKQDIEVHLMVKQPIKYLDDCSKLKVIRVFVHVELFKDLDSFISLKKEFNKKNIEVALVVNPETQVGDFIFLLSQVNEAMLMSVYPGAEGQKFIGEVLDKAYKIKKYLPNLILQIDGGINLDSGRESLSFGIDRLAVGSFISSSQNPKKNFDLLQDLL